MAAFDFRLSARVGGFVPAPRRVAVDVRGVGVAEVEETAEPVVIERFETTDD